MNNPSVPTSVVRYRFAVLSRVVAACLGGYVVTSLLAAALALLLPRVSGATRADGVLVASLLNFAVYTAVALSVFCARSAGRAWLGLCVVTLVAGGIVLSLRALA